MNAPWLSVLPPVITITAAVLTKRIVPSLLLGLLVGSYLLNPSVIGGFETAIDDVVKILTDQDNIQVLLFLYLFSGLIALVRRAGGIAAFSDRLRRIVRTEKGVLYTLWALLPVTFLDCAFRIVGAGSIVRTLAEEKKVPRERVAFVLNNTASPAIELIPIATTFVGFNVANIGQALKGAGVDKAQTAYGTLLRAIPYEFFSIGILLITFLSIRFQWKRPTAAHVKAHPRTEGHDEMNMAMEDHEPEIKPRVRNLVIPLVTTILLSFSFFWYFGRGGSGAGGGISSAIASTNPNKAMLVALFISLIVTGVVYRLQKYAVKRMADDVVSGGNEIMNTLVILVAAWSVGAVSRDLGLSEFIQAQLGSRLPAWGVPAALFVISSAVTYFIGEGWAAASLIMPFGVALAVSSGSGVPICVAAVITGGTFGDVTSPVAGMTNMSSSVTGADHMKYL